MGKTKGKQQQKAQSKRSSKSKSTSAQDDVDIELLMECFEEALSPAQLKAIEFAQAEHEKANNQIKVIRAGNTLVPSSQPNTFTIVPPAPKPQPAPPPPVATIAEPRSFPMPAPKGQVKAQSLQPKPPTATLTQQNERMLSALRMLQPTSKTQGKPGHSRAYHFVGVSRQNGSRTCMFALPTHGGLSFLGRLLTIVP